MQPAPPARAGEPDEPGMSEEAASFAVLGVDIEAHRRGGGAPLGPGRQRCCT